MDVFRIMKAERKGVDLMILGNNEEKRSTLWRTVLTVSSVLIIIIAVFFIVKLFTAILSRAHGSVMIQELY